MLAPDVAANYAGKVARTLVATDCVLFNPENPFTLTSGRQSPVYVDVRKLIGFERERHEVTLMLRHLADATGGERGFDVVAGGETAGIPYAAFLATEMDAPMSYVRKKPKGFGRDARIEGAPVAGSRVLLVEDMATDGGSKVSFVEGLREAGADAGLVAVPFKYGVFPEKEAELAEAGIHVHALATWSDVLEAARQSGRVTEAQNDEVRRFLDDPEGWRPSAAV